ncbi:MAG: DapH/DapD/GlmU-related protein [Nitrospiria bacterium]
MSVFQGKIKALKDTMWNIRADLSIWKNVFLRSIPGNLGIQLRRKFLIKEFGACGENPTILEGFIVDNPQGLYVGDNFICNRGCHFNSGGIVRIGNNVLLGPNVKIWSVNHRFDDISIPINEQGYAYAEVVIGDDVWIGANSFIVPGVNIGRRSILGACTVLTKSVPPFSMVVGNPGKVIKTFQGRN